MHENQVDSGLKKNKVVFVSAQALPDLKGSIGLAVPVTNHCIDFYKSNDIPFHSFGMMDSLSFYDHEDLVIGLGDLATKLKSQTGDIVVQCKFGQLRSYTLASAIAKFLGHSEVYSPHTTDGKTDYYPSDLEDVVWADRITKALFASLESAVPNS